MKSPSLFLSFLIAVTCSFTASAQQKVREVGTYAIKNLTTGMVGVETWYVEGVVDVEYDPDYTTRRVYSQPPHKPTTTLQTENYERRTVERGDASYRFTWGAHPSMMSHTDKTFGHVLITNKKLAGRERSYPIFYEVTQVTQLLLRLTTKTFIDGGLVLVTEETYTRAAYHLPLRINQKTITATGVIVEEINYEKQ